MSARHERGYAAAILLVLVVLGALAGLVGQLNTASTSRGLDNDPRLVQRMDEARRALINYAALHPYRPGGLPCPDRSFPPDGVADEPCNTPAERLGRLPWLSLALPNPVAVGEEPLWYSVSSQFWVDSDFTSGWTDDREIAAFYINSNTQGSIRLYQRQPDIAPNTVLAADRLLAVVIAPGTAIGGQARPSNNPSDYLEFGNADLADDDFETGEVVANFNDRAIGLTHADVFEAVEAAVEQRIRTTVLPALTRYRKPLHPTDAFWNAYPFAVPFSDPTPPAANDLLYRDRTATIERVGLMPIYSLGSALPIAWQAAGAGFASSALTITVGPCSLLASSTMNCAIANTGATAGTFSITANLANAGRAFLLPLRTTDIGVINNVAITSVQVIATLSDAAAGIVISGTIGPGAAGNLSIPIPAYDGALTQFTAFAMPFSALYPTAWFMRNRWFDLVYYGVSAGAQYGASGSGCTAGASCFNVRNANASGTTISNAEVVLVLMGRPYPGPIPASVAIGKPDQPNGQVRTPPANDLYQYLETDDNLARLAGAPPVTFRHVAGRGNFNDRVAFDAR